MKRSPLTRRTPLKRTQFVARRRKPDVPMSVREEVRERSEGLCEIQALGCTVRAVHMHHRIRRSQGGEHVASNLIDACASCHGWVHANVKWAKERGFLA